MFDQCLPFLICSGIFGDPFGVLFYEPCVLASLYDLAVLLCGGAEVAHRAVLACLCPILLETVVARPVLLSIAVLILTLAFILVIDVQFIDGIHNFEEVKTKNSSVLKAIILPVVMLIGIISGELHSLFNNKSDNKITKSDFKAVFSQKSLWKSLLASPIISGVVYSMSSNQTDIVVVFTFCVRKRILLQFSIVKPKKRN